MNEIVRKIALEQIETGLRNLRNSNSLTEIELKHLDIIDMEFDKINKLLYTRGGKNEWKRS